MKKIIGIFIVTLLIGTAIPTLGTIIEIRNVNENEYEYVLGEFIVKFKEIPTSKIQVENLNDRYNVISMDKMFTDVENTPLDNIYKIYVPRDSDILSIVKEYESMSIVEYAEPNYIIKIDLSPMKSQESYNSDLDILKTLLIPNDPLFDQQWNLENTGQYQGTPGADISVLEAWDIVTGSDEVVIAILDSGVDYNHPDLVDNIWINEDEIPDNDIDDNNGYVDDIHGYDFSNLENDELPLDVIGHGTFCAGIAAAATNNGIGISGVAWNCKIMCVQVLDVYQSLRYDVFANGEKYAADNDADIYSMSYGWDDTAFLRSAYEYAYDKDVILIAAAGNHNTSNPRYCYPAAYDFVIGVAATNQRDERCDVDDWGSDDFGNEGGSCFGYWVDIAAPGHNFTSTSPTYAVYEWYDLSYTDNEGGGTSWAAPMVAGIAALLLSQDSTLTNDEVRRIIRANVDPYISEEYIGTGRVNALKALTRANTQPETPAISGETNGKPGREYSFTTSTSDDDGDELWYFWDWGDGNYSEWLGSYNSGDTCEASYTWQQEANFTIKVKAKDGEGGESYWSEEFIFSTPKTKAINRPIINILEQFPNLFSLLRQLLL
jgi:subtilisin family serine protease